LRSIASLLRLRAPVVNVLSSEQSVAEAVHVMVQRGVGIVLVVRRGQLVGVFSERDVVHRVLGRGRSPLTTTLEQVMTCDPITTSPEDDTHTAIAKMQRARCRHLPVLIEGQIADMLSMRDLLFAELAEQEKEVEQLRCYIRGDRTTH
jgi:CBS domain-containing protein